MRKIVDDGWKVLFLIVLSVHLLFGSGSYNYRLDSVNPLSITSPEHFTIGDTVIIHVNNQMGYVYNIKLDRQNVYEYDIRYINPNNNCLMQGRYKAFEMSNLQTKQQQTTK